MNLFRETHTPQIVWAISEGKSGLGRSMCHRQECAVVEGEYGFESGVVSFYRQGKIAGRNINNLRYADDTSLMAESKEELKSFLMKVKEKSEKAG